MTALLILIPIALVLVGGWLAAFMWAMDKGQFDDPEGNANRILLDDTPLPDAPKPLRRPKR